MKIIMNQIKCDNGFVSYDDNLKIKYLQDVPQFYEFYSVEEYLNFILDINHYSKDKEVKIKEVLEMLDLCEYRDCKIKKLSRGLRQKVGIASVIVDEPDVLILDEPVSALDPLGRKEMFDMISLLKGKVTIIFSSHILTDIERVCDHVILINKGRIILNNEIRDLALEKQTLLVTFKDRENLMKFKDKVNYKVNFSEKIKDCLEINSEDIFKAQREVFSILIENEIDIKCISMKSEDLEDIFLREVKK